MLLVCVVGSYQGVLGSCLLAQLKRAHLLVSKILTNKTNSVHDKGKKVQIKRLHKDLKSLHHFQNVMSCGVWI